ncbi:Gfo/Idh/MocA family oxidoreductase [Vibrio chagasii]|nr:Gfo/Idh/MocA family oxidoreductase [Vibrio chagasii]
MEQVKIAVAGAGLIGKHTSNWFLKTRNVQLASIVDPSPGAKVAEGKYGVGVYASLKELFAQETSQTV